MSIFYVIGLLVHHKLHHRCHMTFNLINLYQYPKVKKEFVIKAKGGVVTVCDPQI